MRVPRSQRDHRYLARAVNCHFLLSHTNSRHDFLTVALIGFCYVFCPSNVLVPVCLIKNEYTFVFD